VFPTLSAPVQSPILARKYSQLNNSTLSSIYIQHHKKIRQYLYIQVPKTFLDHCLLLSDLDIKLTLHHFYLEQESPNFTARSVSTLQQLSTALLQIFLLTNTKNKTKVDVVCNRRFIQQKSVPRVALLSFVGMELLSAHKKYDP